MFTFKKRHAGPNYLIIVDIGSGSVGVGITDINTSRATPLLVYSYRAAMRITHTQKKVDHFNAIRSVLLEATLELSSAGLKSLAKHDAHARIQNIAIVCGSPWSKTVTRFISVADIKPFLATHAYVDRVLHTAKEQNTLQTAEAKMRDELGLHIVHHAVIDITLNGYRIHALEGQQGTELTLAHLIELQPKVIRDAVLEAEKNLIPHVPMIEHTTSFVHHSVVRSLFPHTENFMLATITQEATEVTLSQQGILYETSFAEYGLHTLFRNVAKKLSMLPEEARGQVRDFIAGKSTDDVTEAIALVSDEFAETLELTFKKMKEKYVLPQRMFIIADAEMVPYFTSLFARVRGVGASSYTNVIGLSADKISENVEYLKDCPHDVPLALAAYFFHMRGHHKDI